ncbi:hypothetical protein BDF19DRAFT_423101 [Syncephalis fuscata]|nr:hypothetical protein BDF19DRAFT_423101 [Syncephalis fuscata]
MLYATHRVSFYEGASSVNIALLPYDNHQIVVNASNKLGAAVIVTVEEAGVFAEPGP